MNMREEFEKWLSNCLGPFMDISRDDYGVYQLQDVRLAWMAWQAAQPKWIKCSEQMPKHGVPVVVSCEFDGVGDWRFKIGVRTSKGNLATAGWLIPGASWTPTHWIPLPNPPEE
ncbi:DUF551 domain-containing protein [Edwardsiella tarda]